MFRGISQGKKVLRRKEEEKILEGYHDRIRQSRPNTTGYHFNEIPRALNPGKKQMIIEDKFTEIQRENRILLEKITTTMNKRAQSVTERERNQKSLHGSFRKKQLANIEIENARMLKRLQEKKSDYNTEKLGQEWKKQKAVIRNIANYPLIVDKPRKERRRALTKPISIEPMSSFDQPIELMRLRTIDGKNMVVTVKLDKWQLTILGDLRNKQTIKIIDIPREEALQFIQHECGGKIQNIFDRLRYQATQEVLYLVSQGADGLEMGQQEQKVQQ